jgi:hypothetical protein
MTSIDRTIYRRVKRSYTTKELIEAYTPTDEERHFVETTARSPQHRLNLMLWIKLFPCLGYFPWIRFAAAGLMAENDPEEMQKLVRYTDIVANALMVQNVADLTEALAKLEQRGYPVKSEDVARLSAYMTEHLQRFGEYTLNGQPLSPEARSANNGSTVEVSASL